MSLLKLYNELEDFKERNLCLNIFFVILLQPETLFTVLDNFNLIEKPVNVVYMLIELD